MRLLGNILWLVFGGLIAALVWFIGGLILCITIIGIPFGKQCFKWATLSLAPFGKVVNIKFSSHPIANVLWLIFFGWEIFLSYLFSGIVLCITILGIPLGLQAFKFAKLGIFPFGAVVK